MRGGGGGDLSPCILPSSLSLVLTFPNGLFFQLRKALLALRHTDPLRLLHLHRLHAINLATTRGYTTQMHSNAGIHYRKAFATVTR